MTLGKEDVKLPFTNGKREKQIGTVNPPDTTS